MSVQPEFGYVIGAGVAMCLVNAWLGIRVGQARKLYGVKYPALYADASTCKGGEKDANMFNCIQRAHQNTIENLPTFFVLLFSAGLGYPTLTAGAAALYICGRIVYAIGYSTGNPAARNRGAFGYIGLFTMLGCSIATAFNLATSG